MKSKSDAIDPVHMDVNGVSRRSVLMVAAATAVVSGLSIASSGYDPRTSAEGQVKLNATLDGTPAFWTYSGIIYAVLPQVRPMPILAVAGCQANWAVRQPDHSFLLAAPLLSYFRDVESGEWLGHFDNPFSGKRNEVRANMFLGSGRAFYPADGSALRILGPISASESAPQGFKPADPSAALGRVSWSLSRDDVTLNTDHFFDVKIQPQGEAQTRTAARGPFFDARIARLRARFAATTISPWLGWMEMGETEGHLVWHTSGEKVFSIDEIAADYRQHAGSLLESLTARPAL